MKTCFKIWGDPEFILRHAAQYLRYRAERTEISNGCQNKRCQHNSHDPHAHVWRIYPDGQVVRLHAQQSDDEYERWYYLPGQQLYLYVYAIAYHWDNVMVVQQTHLPAEARVNLRKWEKQREQHDEIPDPT